MKIKSIHFVNSSIWFTARFVCLFNSHFTMFQSVARKAEKNMYAHQFFFATQKRFNVVSSRVPFVRLTFVVGESNECFNRAYSSTSNCLNFWQTNKQMCVCVGVCVWVSAAKRCHCQRQLNGESTLQGVNHLFNNAENVCVDSQNRCFLFVYAKMCVCVCKQILPTIFW